MKSARLRALLALLLVATFGLRTSAPDVMRGCGADTGVAHHGGQADPGHQHQHTGHPADRCECVGHSCKVAIAAPEVRAAVLATLSAFHAPAPIPAPLRLAAPRHLLPPAQAPPASLAA
jgi:hypothetical protein